MMPPVYPDEEREPYPEWDTDEGANPSLLDEGGDDYWWDEDDDWEDIGE